MRVFTSDLLFQFGLGFAIGALALALIGPDSSALHAELVSPAVAAEMPRSLTPSPEFLIAPEGETRGD